MTNRIAAVLIRLACVVLLQLLALTSLAMGQTAPPPSKPPVLKFVGTIPLPSIQGRIDHMSIDLKGQRLFASAFGNHTSGCHRSQDEQGGQAVEVPQRTAEFVLRPFRQPSVCFLQRRRDSEDF